MSRPVISVIVPAYNYGRFLRECLDSVFVQTFRDIEVIVIDDGSTDDTPGILESVSEPRLKHFRIPNGGISGARNAGLRRAPGEFVAFLDADDRWRPHKLETELAMLRAEPSVGVVFSDFVRFNEHGFLPNQFTFYPELASVPVRSSSPIAFPEPVTARPRIPGEPQKERGTILRNARLRTLRSRIYPRSPS
jgi:glycosyltransferase involved in cell wall biosynthesis